MIRKDLHNYERSPSLFKSWGIPPLARAAVPDQQCPNIKGSPSPHKWSTFHNILTLLIADRLVDLALDDLASFDIFDAEESLFQHLPHQRQSEQVVKSIVFNNTGSVLSVKLVFACIFREHAYTVIRPTRYVGKAMTSRTPSSKVATRPLAFKRRLSA